MASMRVRDRKIRGICVFIPFPFTPSKYTVSNNTIVAKKLLKLRDKR